MPASQVLRVKIVDTEYERRAWLLPRVACREGCEVSWSSNLPPSFASFQPRREQNVIRDQA